MRSECPVRTYRTRGDKSWPPEEMLKRESKPERREGRTRLSRDRIKYWSVLSQNPRGDRKTKIKRNSVLDHEKMEERHSIQSVVWGRGLLVREKDKEGWKRARERNID